MGSITKITFCVYLGRQFDKDGNLKNWWEQKSLDKFKGKTECIKDQYGEFEVQGVKVSFMVIYNNNHTYCGF